MSDSANFSPAMQIEAERKLLAALCQNAITPDTRATILRCFRVHSFAEPDYEVIYRALAALPAFDPSDGPQALAQAATRLGFPDLDVAALFAEPVSADQIDLLLARLLPG
jgi:hypothetical protein